MKEIIYLLDKKPQSDILEKILEKKEMDKYYLHLGGSILAIFIMILLVLILMLTYKEKLHNTFVTSDNGKSFNEVISLPYPVQSIENVSSWMMEATMASYAFSFTTIDDKLEKSKIYFTPEGYDTFIKALNGNKVIEKIKEQQLQVNIIPTGKPIWINGYPLSDGGEFWRFRMPTLVNYVGGKEIVNQKYMVEVLILRVPGYKNHKALGIAEFTMKPL